jgi:hypothetical protein
MLSQYYIAFINVEKYNMTLVTNDTHQKSEVTVTHSLLLMKNVAFCKFALQLYCCKLARPFIHSFHSIIFPLQSIVEMKHAVELRFFNFKCLWKHWPFTKEFDHFYTKNVVSKLHRITKCWEIQYGIWYKRHIAKDEVLVTHSLLLMKNVAFC